VRRLAAALLRDLPKAAASRRTPSVIVVFLLALPLFAADPIFTDQIPFTISGTTTQPPGTPVTVSVEKNGSATGVVAADGTWW